MKLYEILAFRSLYEKIKDTSLPIKITYKLTKLFHRVQDELNFYQTEQYKILESIALKDDDGSYVYTEDGNGIKIKEGKEKECEEKMNELLNIDVIVDDISFSLDELESLQLSIEDMNCLMPLIKE
jgi:ACT domain-containing protein